MHVGELAVAASLGRLIASRRFRVDVDEQLVRLGEAGSRSANAIAVVDRRRARSAQTASSSSAVGDAGVDQPLLEREDRVALLPRRDLVVGAVLEAEVLDAVVVVEAVGLGLDQRRPVAAPGPGDGLGGRLVDGETSMPSTITPGMP